MSVETVATTPGLGATGSTLRASDFIGVDVVGDVWAQIVTAARQESVEPVLQPLLDSIVLGRSDLRHSLAKLMASKVATAQVGEEALEEEFLTILAAHPDIERAAAIDLACSVERNPAYPTPLIPLLFAKGYIGLQIHRVSHELWKAGREMLASFLQSQVSERLAIDIHPAAVIGTGVFIDHATGVVIGETATVGDDTSILQGVTLGGTGKESGDRHPKVGRGVLLSAGVEVLGNVKIGDYSKVGAGSVVLWEVPPHATVVGVPARVVRVHGNQVPGCAMDQSLDLD